MNRESQSDGHMTFSGAMIKLGAYASYCVIFLIKKFNKTVCDTAKAFASGIASLFRRPERKGKHDTSGDKKKGAGTDMTVNSIRTTGFRQFLSRLAHYVLPAAALTAFAVVLSNAAKIDEQISGNNGTDKNSSQQVNHAFVSEIVTEAPVTEAQTEETVPVTSDVTETAEGKEAVGVFINGELAGCLENESEFKKLLDENLDRYLGQPDVKSAEYEYTIEYRRGVYPDEKLTDTESLAEKLSEGSGELHYTVEEGDSLYWIADDYGLTFEELLEMNPEIKDDPDSCDVGTELTVALKRISIPVIITKEIQEYTVIDYETITTETDELEAGETEYLSWGEEGEGLSTVLVKYNEKGEEISRQVTATEIITEPVNEEILTGTGTGE